MKCSLLFLTFFLLCSELTAQHDFSTAVELAAGEKKTGSVAPSNRNFYLKTLLPADGTVTVYIEGENKQGSAGNIAFYAYDKDQRQIAVNYTLGGKNVAEGEKFKDTVRIYSRGVDSIYLRLYQGSSQTFDISIGYTMEDEKASDPEPNDDFSQPASLEHQQKVMGKIGYIKNGSTDRSDYYKTLLPKSGTITVYLAGTHTGGSSGIISLYAYDRSRRQLYVKYTLGGRNLSFGESFKDTVRIYSRNADSIYLRVYQGSSQSFSYSLQYEVTDQNIEDAEPNDDFPEAAPIVQQETMYGRIGNIANGITDRSDYYKTLLPETGTVKVYIEGVHTGGSKGSLDFYVYDKSKRQVSVSYTLGGKNISLGENFTDTVEIPSRAADSLYFRIYQGSSQSFDYSIRYEMTRRATDDAEPNNSADDAVPIALHDTLYGRIGYIADGVTDRNDYYQAILPADGTLNVYVQGTHTGGSAGSLDLYVFDKSQRQIAVAYTLGEKNISFGEEFSDTVRVFSRAADTLYFRLYQGSSQSFDYTISYEVTNQSINDAEPNDNISKALLLPYQEVREGHIGYIADGVTDRNDYYQAILPADGTLNVYVQGAHTGGSAGSLDLYVFDKSQRQIAVAYTLGEKNISFGEEFSDTVRVFSRAADTLYFRLYQGSSQSFDYTISYEVTDQSINDNEPNNSFDDAFTVALTDTTRGLIGYVDNDVNDANDYYVTAIPAYGNFKIFADAQNTGAGKAGYAIYVYTKNKKQAGYKAIAAVDAGVMLKDTITVNCIASDSVYIRIYQPSSARSFSYQLQFAFDAQQPQAKIAYTRTGNEFGFINKSKGADSLVWKLGDQTTTITHPLQEFKPGFYKIELMAINKGCKFIDTATQDLTISGVESFTPTEAGIGGDLIMTIFGGGLTENTKVTLTGNGTQYNTINQFADEKGRQLGAMFDLHFATTGQYDLSIEFPDQPPVVYEKAITIDSMVYPETWSEVTGPSVWRTGRSANFNLVVGNKGNVIARGPIVALAWPKSTKIEFAAKEYRPDFDEYSEVVLDDGEVVRTKNEVVEWIYNLDTSVPIDTFGLEPFDGYIRYFSVPAIPVGSTYELPFKVTSDISGIHQFKTFTIKPNQFGSCETFNIAEALTGPKAVELYINTFDIIIDEVKVPPATKIPAQVAIKSLKIGQKHIDVGSKIAFHRFWNWWYGQGDLTESEYFDYYKQGEAANEFAVNELKNIALDQTINLGVGPLAKKRADKLTEQYQQSQQTLLNINKKLERLEKKLTQPKYSGEKKIEQTTNRLKNEKKDWQEAFASGEKTIKELTQFENLNKGLKAVKYSKTAYEEVKLLYEYIEENCPEQKEQLKALKDFLGKELDIVDQRDKKAETRTSFDPNAIYGPSGFKTARYVNAADRQPFIITFENVDTAKADAQIVTITDTLDKHKFDLSTFEFGSVTIGNKYFKVPKGRTQFIMEHSLAPKMNMKVRINAALDTITGIVFWQFTSIDPATGDLPDYYGFLPPNVNYPSGEGSVSYTVKPSATLADGTKLISRASITFDSNEPILTNTWQNTIDAEKPQANLRAQVIEDTIIKLEFNAFDAGSGVGYYNFYMSEDGKEWVPLPDAGNATDSIFLTAEPGKTYEFYVEARDRVGNQESKAAVGEAVVSLPDNPGLYPEDANTLLLYPVPSNGTIALELNVPDMQQVNISVYSTSGQRVAELYNGTIGGPLKITRTLHQLSSGVYFVQAKGSKGLNIKKKLVLVK